MVKKVTGYSLKARKKKKDPLLPMAKSLLNNKNKIKKSPPKNFHYSSFN